MRIASLFLLLFCSAIVHPSHAQTFETLASPSSCSPGANEFGYDAVFLDYDGDGDLEVAISEPGIDVVWVFFLSSIPNAPSSWLAITSAGPGSLMTCPSPSSGADRFGFALGKVNLDPSTPDEQLLIGAPEALSGKGRVYVASLSTIQTIDTSNSSALKFGSSVAGGDFNGDSVMDIAAGSPATTVSGVAAAGMLHLFLPTEVQIGNPGVPGGTAVGGFFAEELVSHDDDGDGLWELFANAAGNDAPGHIGENAGAAYWFPNPSQPSSVVAIYDPNLMDCDDPGPRFAQQFHAREDLLIVGARRKDEVDPTCSLLHDLGGVFLYSGVNFSNAQQLTGDPSEQDNDLLGFAAVIADVVGNGTLDYVFIKQRTKKLYVWDRSNLSTPQVFSLPSGSTYLQRIDAGQRFAGGKEEVLICDPRYNSDHGRIVIVKF